VLLSPDSGDVRDFRVQAPASRVHLEAAPFLQQEEPFRLLLSQVSNSNYKDSGRHGAITLRCIYILIESAKQPYIVHRRSYNYYFHL
jgi:hypothetical protein